MTKDDSAATNEPHEDDALDRKVTDQPSIAPGNWVTKVILALVGIVGAYILFRTSAAFFPRWWARQIKDPAAGDMTPAVLWGVFFGFVFTFVPLLLIFQIRRHFFNWTWRLVVVVIGLLLAAPNWLTLWIVLGSSNAAHDGDRILSDNAPGFRWASLIAACVGALLALIVTSTGMVMKRRKTQVKQLRGQLAERDKPAVKDDESR